MVQTCQDQQVPGGFEGRSYGFGVSAVPWDYPSEAHDLWDLFGSGWRESGHLRRAHVRRAVGLRALTELMGLVADFGISIFKNF